VPPSGGERREEAGKSGKRWKLRRCEGKKVRE